MISNLSLDDFLLGLAEAPPPRIWKIIPTTVSLGYDDYLEALLVTSTSRSEVMQ